MSTRNIIPRENGEGSLGLDNKRWGAGHFGEVLKKEGYMVAVEFLNIPSVYSRFELVRDGAQNVTGATYFDADNNVIGAVTIGYDSGNNPTTITDGTKTLTLTYGEDGKLTGGSVA